MGPSSSLFAGGSWLPLFHSTEKSQSNATSSNIHTCWLVELSSPSSATGSPLPMFPSGPIMRSVALGPVCCYLSVISISSFTPLRLISRWQDSFTVIPCITSLHLYITTALHLHHIIVSQLPIWLKNSTDSSLRRIKRILNRNPSRKLPQIRPSDTVAAHLMVIHRLSNGWRHQRTRGSQSGSNAQDPSSDSLFCEIRWRGNYSWEQDGNALLAAGCKDGWVKCFWWSHCNIITQNINCFIFVNSGILAFI